MQQGKAGSPELVGGLLANKDQERGLQVGAVSERNSLKA